MVFEVDRESLDAIRFRQPAIYQEEFLVALEMMRVPSLNRSKMTQS